MNIGILGGGLSGIATAYFLQKNDRINSIEILERESEPGGLCRSFNLNGLSYDIGPHIIFSKDNEILDLMINILGENKNKLKRSNKIYYKKSFIKYPFENELSALPEDDKKYCLNTFLHNPYENIDADNLLKFFLKTFGEGITNTYLKPYNEKIWKFDLSFMDTQMVDRIPKPPREDIINSAAGIPTEGYLHQLYFYYPRKGGIKSLIKAFTNQFDDRVSVIPNSHVIDLRRIHNKWKIKTDQGCLREYDLIISTIPVQSLAEIYQTDMPKEIIESVNDLKYNSIIIAIINVRKDNLGDNFAVMVPDKKVIFHRISKLDFLGESYRKEDGSTTLMAEITYSKGSPIDKMSSKEVERKIIEGLEDVQFIDHREQINFIETRRFEYAYVLCDLNHRSNMNLIRNYFAGQGIRLCGRFGEFEYLNMDAVIRHAKDLSEEIGKNLPC
ncbi:MAG: FAD-dependent oxidoreductase [Deltaproteobacteria bacterium HGW-Deltaproteobacteria-13]|jgi:protoporphyrinogen oxidase|nr:MAG: FAD-dependent oxidoreductase [Deltaproteobacteria bacterium HGW-Deltaproteobacteria-13]